MGQEYLIIFEDGSMGKTSKVTPDLQQASKDGYVTIVNMTNATVLNPQGIYEEILEIDQ